MYLEENSIDDILIRLYRDFSEEKWQCVDSSKGKNYEKSGVLIKLSNPLSRISKTEGKGTIFSCIGELIWYLSGSKSLNHIQYYLRNYDQFSDDSKTVFGAYGPRIFGPKRRNQIEKIIKILNEKPNTRQAVVQIFSRNDIIKYHKDIPCTCTMQFIIRKNRLQLFVCMRSNDIYKGLPHDIFSFTMIQEIVARRLGIELGEYSHYTTSLHLYKKDIESAHRCASEGWQESLEMPPMPQLNIGKNIKNLIAIESKIRYGKLQYPNFSFGDPYWDDLVKVLIFFWHCKNEKSMHLLRQIEQSVEHDAYRYYLNKKIHSISQ